MKTQLLADKEGCLSSEDDDILWNWCEKALNECGCIVRDRDIEIVYSEVYDNIQPNESIDYDDTVYGTVMELLDMGGRLELDEVEE